MALREADGELGIHHLESDVLSIGRDPESSVPIVWDRRVSAAHAEFRRMGSSWVVVDDGLSRNGTFVNAQRVVTRSRVRDGDVIRIGDTRLVFQDVGGHGVTGTEVDVGIARVSPSPAQQKVLIELCRPMRDGFAAATSTREISRRLDLSEATVKSHLKELFSLFGVTDVEQGRKRTELARLAIEEGVVSRSELSG